MPTTHSFPHNTAISILEQIQLAERECAQQIQAAEKQAEDKIRAAHQKVTQMERDTPETHQSASVDKHQDVIIAAEQDASELIEQAKVEASELGQASDAMINHFTAWALEIVIGKRSERDT